MRASSPSSAAPVPAATVPLACSCDELQRAQQRLQALASQCSERIDRLSQAFDMLPAAASFDPFSQAAPAPVAEGAASESPAQRRSRSASPNAKAPQAATPPGRSAPAGHTGLPQRAAGADRTGHGAPLAMPAAEAGKPAEISLGSMNDWLGSLGRLSTLGGEQVALLMQRQAAPTRLFGRDPAVAVARALGRQIGPVVAAARQQGAARVAGVELGDVLSRAARALVAAPGQTWALSPALLQGQAEGQAAAASTGQPPEDPSPVRVSAPQLLERLLSRGLGQPADTALGGSRRSEATARQAAPRAASRLVSASPPAAQDDTRAPSSDAPASGALEASDAGEALAQQINQLLLDQAWLRGVDLK